MSEEKIGKGALLVPCELGLILWVDLKSKVDAKDKTGNAADETGEKSIKWERSYQAAVDELNDTSKKAVG